MNACIISFIKAQRVKTSQELVVRKVWLQHPKRTPAFGGGEHGSAARAHQPDSALICT